MHFYQSKDAVFTAFVLDRLTHTSPMVACDGDQTVIYEPIWRNGERASARFNRYLRPDDRSSIVASVLMRTALLPSIKEPSWVLQGALEFQDFRRGRDRFVYEFTMPIASDIKDAHAAQREANFAFSIADAILEFLVTARVPGEELHQVGNFKLLKNLKERLEVKDESSALEERGPARRTA